MEPSGRQNHDIVVIGASAGGVEAIAALVSGLPPDLAAAVFVVVHFPGNATSVMPRILSRAGLLQAVHAADHMPIRPGLIYVAPPDRHLLLEPDEVRVIHGPRENGHRPAVDPLFRSAARAFGPRVIGVVLTGSGSDGTAGAIAVQRCGGSVVVQDPADAFMASMPRSVTEYLEVDHSVPLAGMASLLARLVLQPVPQEPPPHSKGEPSVAEEMERGLVANVREDSPEGAADPTRVSGFTCPDCGGRLWELRVENLTQFHCRVGRRYSPASLMNGKSNALESALWSALNVMEENASLANRLADDARRRNHGLSASRFQEKARDLEGHITQLRGLLMGSLTDDPTRDDEMDTPDEAHPHTAETA